MKKKPTSKKTAPKPSKTPAIIVKKAEKIPKGLKFFAQLEGKSSVEILTLIRPQIGTILTSNDPAKKTAKEAICGFFSALFPDLGNHVPSWVKKSSEKLFASAGINFLADLQNSKNSLDNECFGKSVGFMEQILNKENPSEPEKALANFTSYAKAEAANDSPQESKKFFDGRAKGPKLLEQADNPSQRANIYACIICHWSKIAEMKSAGQLHQLLLQEKVILPQTDPAETRKVCRLIGLKFPAKAGRPPK